MPDTLNPAGVPRCPATRRSRLGRATAVAALALSACGGGEIENPQVTGGQKLSFAYFQRCIYPIFLAQLPIRQGNTMSVNTCAAAGCHDNTNGTGGAFRVVQNAMRVDVRNPANTPDVIRATDMYKNFFSAQAAVVIGSTAQSRLLTKPLVQGVLHGGGVVFETPDDPNAKLFAYWLTHPAPAGQDEFSAATFGLFTPPDPDTGTCNTQ